MGRQRARNLAPVRVGARVAIFASPWRAATSASWPCPRRATSEELAPLPRSVTLHDARPHRKRWGTADERAAGGARVALLLPGQGSFAFGAGQRICLGEFMGQLEGKIMVAMLLQRYRLELDPWLHRVEEAVFAAVWTAFTRTCISRGRPWRSMVPGQASAHLGWHGDQVGHLDLDDGRDALQPGHGRGCRPVEDPPEVPGTYPGPVG